MTMELQHDEINLFRLVRRLEKSAQLSNKVELEDEDTRRRIWAQCQKEIQVRSLFGSAMQAMV